MGIRKFFAYMYDTVAKTFKIGDTTGSNYSEFESNGTLRFNGTATVFDDIFIPIATGKTPATNFPAFADFTTNTKAYKFAIGDYIDLGTVEIPHKYKEGTDLEVHVHLATNGVDTSDRYVKYEAYYTYGIPNNFSHQFTAEQTVSGEIVIPANTLDKSVGYLSLGIIPGSVIKIGTQLKLRLKRIAASSTAPSSDTWVGQVGVHYEIDTVGSRTRNAK